jgi:O-antigen ligase
LVTSRPRVVWLLAAAFPVALAWAVDVRALLGVPGSFSFFVAPKWGVFVTAALLALAVVIAAPPRLRRDAAGAAWWVALLALLLAPWFASATPWETGYLGIAARRDGALLMIGSLLLMAAGATLARRDPRTLAWGVGGFLAATCGVALIAVLQAQEIDVWGVAALAGLPPRATIGSHAFASAWTGMAAVLALQAALQVARAWWLRIGMLLAAGGLAYATAAAGGRAATLALVGVVALMLLRFAWRAWRQPALRGYLLLALLLLPLTVVGAASSSFAADRLERLGVLLDPERFASADAERLIFYRQALRALAQQPLRPYGPATFAFLVWHDLSPEEELALLKNRVAASDASLPLRRIGFEVEIRTESGDLRRAPALIDKVHNYPLDLAIAFGVLPAVALLVAIAAVLLRVARSGDALARGVAWAALLYALAVQAWFPALSTDPALFALVGLAWGAATPAAAAPPSASAVSRAAARRAATPP